MTPPTYTLHALPGCDLTACSSVYLVLGKSKMTNEMAVCSSPILTHIVSVASKQVPARGMLLTVCACDSLPRHPGGGSRGTNEPRIEDVGSAAENCRGFCL